MATKLGQKNPWCEFIMMMTFMEVKGHQRSNVVNYVLWLPNYGQKNPCIGYQTWSEESLMQVYDDDDLHGGQRSSEVKCGNYVLWLPNLVRRNPGASLWWWRPSWRSKVIRGWMWQTLHSGYQTWSERVPDASLWWWWPSWRSEVIRGQM